MWMSWMFRRVKNKQSYKNKLSVVNDTWISHCQNPLHHTIIMYILKPICICFCMFGNQ